MERAEESSSFSQRRRRWCAALVLCLVFNKSPLLAASLGNHQTLDPRPGADSGLYAAPGQQAQHDPAGQPVADVQLTYDAQGSAHTAPSFRGTGEFLANGLAMYMTHGIKRAPLDGKL